MRSTASAEAVAELGPLCGKKRAVSQISSQQHQCEIALQNDGWRIVHRDTDLDGWADEVWTVESVWRPTVLQAFITYLVDPFPYSANRKQSEGVWAVRCTESWPSNDDGGVIAEESLEHWAKKLLELMADLSRFRDSAVIDN